MHRGHEAQACCACIVLARAGCAWVVGGPSWLGWLHIGCCWPELARLATHSFCRGNSVELGAVQFDSVQLGSVQFGSTQFNSVQLGSIRFNSHRRPHVSSAVHVDVLRPANNQPTLPGVSRYFPAVPWLSPGVSQRPRCLPAVSPPPGCLPAVSRMSPGLPDVSRRVSVPPALT